MGKSSNESVSRLQPEYNGLKNLWLLLGLRYEPMHTSTFAQLGPLSTGRNLFSCVGIFHGIFFQL